MVSIIRMFENVFICLQDEEDSNSQYTNNTTLKNCMQKL